MIWRVSQELCWKYQFIHRELGMASLLSLKSFQAWSLAYYIPWNTRNTIYHLFILSNQKNTFLLYFDDYDIELYLKLGHLWTHSNSGLI